MWRLILAGLLLAALVGCAAPARPTPTAQPIAVAEPSPTAQPTAPATSTVTTVPPPTTVPTSTPIPSPTPVPASPTPAGPPPTPTTGPWQSEMIVSGGRGLMVVDPQFTSELGYSKPAVGMEYLVVLLGLVNMGTTRVSYNPFDFKVQDGKGNISGPALVVVLQRPMRAGELAPDGVGGGQLAFEVPKGDRKLTLIWRPCAFGCPEQQVRLQESYRRD